MTSDESVSVDGEISTDSDNTNKCADETNNERCHQRACNQNFFMNSVNKCEKIENDYVTSEDIINDILTTMVDNVTQQCFCPEQRLKERTETHQQRRRKALYRSVSVCIDSDSSFQEDEDSGIFENKRDSLYSLKEHDEELELLELENKKNKKDQKINYEFINKSTGGNKVETKTTKNSFFSSVFFKKKSKKDLDVLESNLSNNKLNKKPLQQTTNSKRHSSKPLDNPVTTILKETTTNLSRAPSIKKKLSNFLNKDAPSLLKRSFSFKDLSKRREKERSRGKLSEMKNLEWASSLQSLVETDIGISYNDLSFINYDVQNEISYKKVRSVRNLQRAQSLHENTSSSINRKPNLSRGTSFPRHYQSVTDLSSSGALSLPFLHHFEKENVEAPLDEYRHVQKYRRRPPSICSDDGNKIRQMGNGSFKSAGGGCAKLKRHNACRQKSRELTTPLDVRNSSDETVRSKSLTHLDEIEMRQSMDPPTDTGLKDSKSEPDCARTLLAPPVRTIPTPEPSITSTSDPIIDPPAKRHVLTRSQKSSSECFSVNFEVGDEATWDNELFFPAVRGITLNDSLIKLCELRNIDLNSCDAWLQDKSSNTNAWLPFSQDTACLVGKHVRITAKDAANNKRYSGSIYGTHSRKASSSNSKSRASSFFSSSIEDGSTNTTLSPDSRFSFQDYDSSKKQPKQRWSGFFTNTKDTKMELLVEQLNNYAKNGIPNCQIYPQGQCESIDALYKLEGDWREMIDVSDLSEKLQQQQTALWELIKTEVAYIKTLKVVTDLFLACLKNLQSINLLKEIDTEKLFSNITEILDANVLFWRNCIFPLVRDMRRYKQPPCIENMLQGFLKISETFQAYFRYCAEQGRCQHYCRENHTHNELFTAYLAWCETQKECNRLRLMDILVQPMQRLTKYGLLLKAILRNTDDDVEKDNLNLMIKSVDDFVNNVNLSLKQKQDNERLKGIMARIESYDVVESKDDDLEKILKSYNQLDLNKPMIGCPPERKRHLLLEGDLKLKDSSTSKMEVHCFLLTDILLVCKPSTKKGGATMRIIRQPYLVDRLVITELTRETPSLAVVYKNEFDLPVAAFILQNNDNRKLKSWKDSINKAQLLYHQAKQTSYHTEESVESDYTTDYILEGDYHSLQLIPRSPLPSSSRASRVSSLAHSHSGSVEMNDQSSVGSVNQSRGVSMENENRTASISSDEGVQPIPSDKSPVSQKLSFKHRLFNKTPNTLSVQPYGNLGQSLPNLTLGSPNIGTFSLNLSQNTLSVPNTKNGSHLLSPTHRGVSYPPPSPTRGNLKRGLAISQNKNPPLIKTRHVTSTVCPSTTGQTPASFDFDVPVIAGISSSDDSCETFSRGQHRQAMLKRIRNDSKRYHTAGVVDDIKHIDNKDPSIHKRLSWNCSPQEADIQPKDPT